MFKTNIKEQVDTHEHWTVKEKCVLDTGIKCEACRANKPARYEVKLDSDNSSSSRTLYLGSECRRKGEMYHKFFHFELHMYNHIQQVVTGMMFKNPFLNKNTVHEALIQSGFIKNVRLFITLLNNLLTCIIESTRGQGLIQLCQSNLQSKKSKVADCRRH